MHLCLTNVFLDPDEPALKHLHSDGFFLQIKAKKIQMSIIHLKGSHVGISQLLYIIDIYQIQFQFQLHSKQLMDTKH